MTHRLRSILCALSVLVCSAAVTSGQQPKTFGPLPADLRAHLQTEQFAIVTSIRGLPLGVREQMQPSFGGFLDIAEPGAKYQTTDVLAVPQLPTRRLVSAGCSRDFHCLVYYERGGIAHTWHVMLFRWTPDTTRFEWGGDAPGGLATIEDVRNAVASGTIKGHTGAW